MELFLTRKNKFIRVYSGREINNYILGSQSKTGAISQSERNTRKLSNANVNQFFNSKCSYLNKNKETFSLFLKIVGETQLRARSSIVVQPFLDLFILDPQFEKMCNQFTRSIFEQIISLVTCTKNVLEESGLLEDEADDFKSHFDRKKIHLLTSSDQKLILCAKHVDCLSLRL